MLPSQRAPQQLPVQVRPIRGETVVSYATRLATANELARPTIMLRAIGQPRVGIPHATELFDVRLNQHSLRRLEIFTGIPADRLTKALPSLRNLTATPATIPAIHPVRTPQLRRACHTCTARIPGHPDIQTYPMLFPRICARHNRWIDSNPREKVSQFDLTATPELITAHRRYSRLREQARAQGRDPEWVRQQLWSATWIIAGWAERAFRAITTTFRDRVETRLQATGLTDTPGHRRVLVFPEAVALAELFCDLDWRRHVAMLRHEHDCDMDTFVRAVGQRLGQPPTFAIRLRFTSSTDPLRTWIRRHRYAYTSIRDQFYTDPYGRSYISTRPFPEIRHFK